MCHVCAHAGAAKMVPQVFKRPCRALEVGARHLHTLSNTESAVRLCIITLCKYASCSFAHSLSQVLFSNYALYSDTKVSYSHPCRDSCFDSTRKTFIRQQNKNFQIVHMSTIPAIKASLFCLQKYTHHRNSYQLYILL